MYYVEIKTSKGWMISIENISNEAEAISHWRECVADGYESRIGWENI